jgi:general secretion pathway protein F
MVVALYAYKAVDAAGEIVTGEMESGSETGVVQRLQQMGLLPVEARPARSAATIVGSPRLSGRKPKAGDVTTFTRELAILLAAGQPLEQALDTLATGAGLGRIGAMAARLLEQVRAGVSLSSALEAQGGVFPKLYVNMIKAGESSGTLEVVLDRLADLRERGEKIREMIGSAMIYPAILVFVSLASIYLLLTFVVPQFETIFADSGAALPTPTAIVIAIGRTLQDYGWMILLGLAGAFLAARQILTLPGPRLTWDGAMLKLPLAGSLIRILVTARFCRTLATLVGNGVDLPNALALSRDVIPNRHVTQAMEAVVTGVRQGRGLADPLAEMGVFPPLAVQMLRVGEETGRIDVTATHIADAYERKLETAIKRMVTLVEPALIIVLGMAVGGIVMSILLAVIGINDLAF